jgi:outer membrane protein assembly factor BamB
VIGGDLIFITGAEIDADRAGKLCTLAIDRGTGKIVWRREIPHGHIESHNAKNSSASATPVTDGENAYVFFGDFGLLSYSKDGAERWRLPLGPLNNPNGTASSPILYKGLVILILDQDSGSYLLAVDKDTGRVRWKTLRPDSTRSYVTPAVFQPKDGPAELIVPGSYDVTSYFAATGEKAWWVRGLSWQPKSVPVIDGDMIYVNSWESGGEVAPVELPAFADVLAKYDINRDGKLTAVEFAADPETKIFDQIDLDRNGAVDEREWNFHRARKSARNNLVAIRHGGHGDLTATNVVWNMQKLLPNCPSPLIYQGALYLIRDGGILTALDPKTGKILKQGRLRGAMDPYFASPVAALGKIYFISEQGKATVVKAGADWEILAVNDLNEDAYATPAIFDNKLYVRTRQTLFCFSEKE